MKGQTCGVCGKADGEVRQEYRTPSGRLTKSSVSHAHSWVVPAESCADTNRKTYRARQYLSLYSHQHQHSFSFKLFIPLCSRMSCQT